MLVDSGSSRRTVCALTFAMVTGDDDLRGGNDNVFVELRFAAGGPWQYRTMMNDRRRWADRTAHFKRIDFPCTTTVSAVRWTTPSMRHGSFDSDNWDLKTVYVAFFYSDDTGHAAATSPGYFQILPTTHDGRLFRFTGDRKSLTFPDDGVGRASDLMAGPIPVRGTP